jgi:hypothetical protein
MSITDFDFLAIEDLPSHETIVALCDAAGYDCTGIPLRSHSSGPIIAWVKYGYYRTIAEALTQDYVAKVLNSRRVTDVRVPRVYQFFETEGPLSGTGYIVMEYIEAEDCGKKDHKLVAKAVQTLISVKGPNSTPGPVGGGRINHNFFMEWRSDIKYETVEELQQHINGVSEHSFSGKPR